MFFRGNGQRYWRARRPADLVVAVAIAARVHVYICCVAARGRTAHSRGTAVAEFARVEARGVTRRRDRADVALRRPSVIPHFAAAAHRDRDRLPRDRKGHRRACREVRVQVCIGIGGFGDVDGLAVVARARLGDRCCTRIAELRRIEQCIAAARGHRRPGGLCAAVVFLCVAAAVHHNRDCFLRDRQLHGIAYRPGNRVVGIAIRAICLDYRRRVVAHICTFRYRVATVAELGPVETRCGARRSHRAGEALFVAIIGRTAAVTVHADGHLGLRDLQPAVRHRETHVVVCVRRAELILRQVHHVLTLVLGLHIRRTHGCRAAERDVAFRQRGAARDAD